MEDVEKKARQLKLLKIVSAVLGVLLALIFSVSAAVNAGAASFLMLVGAILVLPITWFLVGKFIRSGIPYAALMGAGVVAFALGLLIVSTENKTAAAAQGFANVQDYKAAKALKLDAAGYAKHKAEEEAVCRSSLKCWAEKNEKSAAGRCMAAIQDYAKYEYEWTSGVMPTFAQYAWVNKGTGVISYLGDQIKFKNAFGVFSQYRYSCSYNPSTGEVTGVEVVQGKLL